jgi:hypothetical protein
VTHIRICLQIYISVYLLQVLIGFEEKFILKIKFNLFGFEVKNYGKVGF